jgi:Cft2 family RNA processing exonuclease
MICSFGTKEIAEVMLTDCLKVQELSEDFQSPSVIIASSGMMTGGASVYYGKILLERENAAVFISGYTDEESPGRLLQGFQSGTEIELNGTKLTVRSQIRKFNCNCSTGGNLTKKINPVECWHEKTSRFKAAL